MVPEGWGMSTLGECVSIIKSGLSRKLSSNDIGLPMIRSCNMGEKYASFYDIKYWYVADPQGAKTRDYYLNEGDILVNFINSVAQIGKTCIYRDDLNRDCIYTTNILRLKSRKSINHNYLFYVTKTERYNWYIQTITKPAVNQASFTTKDLRKYHFPLPPLQEQNYIAELLSTWDLAIEKTERQIEAKEKVEKSLILKLLFGKVRVGGRRTTGVKEKRWLSVPSDWKIVKIGSVSKEVSARNQNGDDVPVLSCTKYDGLVDSLKYFDKQIFSKDTSTYKVVAHGQFAYATNHIEEGSIGYQTLYPQGLVSPMYTVFETDKQKVNDGYLYKLLKTETYRRIFEINTNASVDRRGSLRWNEFSKLHIPFPPIDEQKEINEVLDTAQKEVDLLEGHLDLLKKQKRGLMQKLLTGQWRIK